MESQHSNCIESIKRHFYNIPPISGSLHLVLTCPDVEIPPWFLIIPSFFVVATSTTCYYHQHFVEDGIYTSFSRWICLSTPFDHSTSGCPAISKVSPHSDDPEFFCCPHHHHFPLQSEHLGMWNLDHSFTLNLPVNSIWP